MSVIVFEHTPVEDSARLGFILQQLGHHLKVVQPDRGDPIPPDLDNVDGLIVMGGPMNVDQGTQHPWIDPEIQYVKSAHDAGLPIVGICLGAQMIAAALGGTVAPMPAPEIGWEPVKLAFPGTVDTIFAGIGWETVQFHLHGQEVTQLPPTATPLAGSKACRHQAFRVGLTTYAFQYHFEWDMENLKTVVQDAMVTQAGRSPDQILQEARTYFEDYRRLGDRVCHSLAMNLFAAALK